MSEHFDVLIVGAGISGIGMACHLQKESPGKRYAILERRSAIGGTWDLFRYPGVRSDSDMFSFAYAFRPWMSPKVLSEGRLVREYVKETAEEYGVDRHIRFGLKILKADWSSDQNLWTITALKESTGETSSYTCNFFVSCTGYYDYDQGHLPVFPGFDRFKGQTIHPQFWPENLDYRGKRVVVIGSGATAVTIVPAMVAQAAHVTMLQRTPTYYFIAPTLEKAIAMLGRILPARWIYGTLRSAYIALQRALYKGAKRWPDAMRKFMLRPIQKMLGDTVDMRHFTPSYNPWDQRMCVVPDGDLFKAIKSGKATIVTDEISTFTEHGILLKSGETLDADIVVTATGIRLKTFGGMDITLDGAPVATHQLLSYRAVLMQDLPNMAFIFGYTNASWTLKADIASRYVCRLLNYMDSKGIARTTPRAPAGQLGEGNVMSSLTSGYILRDVSELPRQGRSGPWRVTHAYEVDKTLLLNESIDDGALEFVRQA
jgi:cation diffusion facilitator CzcD-associated flavoprotein CzcO